MLDSELQTFLPLTVDDTDTNGGRMSPNQVISGVVQNVWSHVTKAERIAGSRKYRKLFDKVSNDNDEALLNPQYYLDGDSLGEDWFLFYPVGQDDTQIDWVTNSPPSRKYVSGTLKTTIAADATSLTIAFKDAEQASHVLDADLVRISDKSDPDSLTGSEVFLNVSGVPVVSDAEATISFASVVGFAFTDTVTKISVVYEHSEDVQAEVGTVTVTSASGTFDESLMVLDHIATTREVWTFTFTGPTSFTVSGDSLGAQTAGTTGTEYSITNTDWSKPNITIPIACWGGTYQDEDIVTIPVNPAALPLVQERRVPAGCASLANNRIRKVTTGEALT